MAHVATKWAASTIQTMFGNLVSAFNSAMHRKAHSSDIQLVAEDELRINDHKASELGLSVDDVKRALMKPRHWF